MKCQKEYTKIKIRFQTYDSSNNKTNNKSFRISLKIYPYENNNVIVKVPLFNFQISSITGYIKSTSNNELQKLLNDKQEFSLANNDAYLNGNSNALTVFGIPTTNNSVSSFQWIFNRDGTIIVKSGDPTIIDTNLPFGSHTQLATSLVLSSTSSQKCKNYNKTKLKTLVCWNTDSTGYPISGTQFNLQLQFQKKANNVYALTILPVVLELLSQSSIYSRIEPSNTGGYIKTNTNPLPKKFRPGTNQVYSIPTLSSDNATFPSFNFLINTYGQVFISATKWSFGVIPTGTYNLQQTTVSYITGSDKITNFDTDDFLIQKGFTNISTFPTDSFSLDNGIRDSHVHDTFGDYIYWCWTSNKDQIDQSNGVTNVYLARGKIKKNKKIKLEWVKILTQLLPNMQAWDTAVAINRKDPSIIIVSYALIFYEYGLFSPHAIILHNYGQKFISDNTIDPNVNAGDCRGVLADPKGNFWYNCTNLDINYNYDPVTYISKDMGQTWDLVGFVTINPGFEYDYPQIAYGPDGQGNEGLWISSTLQNFIDFTFTILLQFINVNTLVLSSLLLNPDQGMQGLTQINVKSDGTVFLYALVGLTFQSCVGITIKKPGPLTLDLVQNAITVYDSAFWQFDASPAYPLPNSWPNALITDAHGYFLLSVQGIFFTPNSKNSCKQRINVIINEAPYIYSQDYYQFMIYSDDEGTTWSKKIYIPETHKNNRGFSCSVYNEKHKLAILGWYDSRNSENSF